MSKLFVLVFVSLVIQYSLQSQEFREKLKCALQQCKALEKDSEKALESMKPDPAVKKFFNCMGLALNLVTAEGKPKRKNIRDFLCLMGLKEKSVDMLIERCATASAIPEDTVFDMVRCAKKFEKQIDND